MLPEPTQRFMLGDCLVEPAKGTLSCPKGVATLEPLVMDLLCALARSPGQVLSKDTLLEQVWPGRLVSDSSIQWTVSRLRRELAAVGLENAIRTVPKKGYCLQLLPKSATDPTPATVDEPPPTPTAGEPPALTSSKWAAPRRHWLPWLLLVVVMSAALIWQAAKPPATAELSITRFTALTALPGREELPVISPDGRHVAFMHQSSPEAAWHIYLSILTDHRLLRLTDNAGRQTAERRRSARLLPPLALTAGPASDAAPAWSPDGRSLLFRRHYGGRCEIMLLTLAAAEARTEAIEPVAACHPRSAGRIAWASDAQVFVADREDEHAPHSIFRIDLLSGRRDRLTSPRSSGDGDRVLALSPDRQRLAWIRASADRRSEIWIHDIANARDERIAEAPHPIQALSWDAQGQALRYAWADGSVVSLDLASRRLGIWRQTGGPVFATATLTDGRLLYVRPTESQNILLAERASRSATFSPPRPWIRSTHADTLPTFARRSTRMLFISDRSGLPQMWIKEEDGSERQLSDAREHEQFSAIEWSPDDLALLGVNDGSLITLSLVRSDQSLQWKGSSAAFNPAWTADGRRILFSREVQGRWQGFSVAANDEPSEADAIDGVEGFRLRETDSGELYFSRYDEDGLWRHDVDGPQRVLDDLPAAATDWQLVPDGVIYAKAEPVAGIYKFSFADGQEQRLLSIQDGSTLTRFALSADGLLLALALREATESDLMIEQQPTE